MDSPPARGIDLQIADVGWYKRAAGRPRGVGAAAVRFEERRGDEKEEEAVISEQQ